MNRSNLFHYWQTRYEAKLKEHDVQVIDLIMEEVFPNARLTKVAYHDDAHDEWVDMSAWTELEQIKIYEEQVATASSNESKVRYHEWSYTEEHHKIWIHLGKEVDQFIVVHEQHGSMPTISVRSIDQVKTILKTFQAWKKHFSK